MRRLPLLAAALLALLSTMPAAADEVAEARARFDQGAKLFRAGRYREAIGQFEAAYRIKPHGALHFDISQCREKLQEWPAALRSYQDYLREVPEASDRAAVRAAIGRIEHRLASAGVQALLVYTNPPGAEVRLDGKPVGRTPFHITLPPRAYLLNLSLDGYQMEEREAVLAVDSARVVELVLRPAASVEGGLARRPGEPAPRAASAAGAVGASPAAAARPPEVRAPAAAPDRLPGPDLSARAPAPGGVDVPLPPPPAPAGPSAGGRRFYTWIAAGAAVVAGGAGVWYGLAARQKERQLRDGSVHPDAAALARAAKSDASTANVLYGLSGLAAAGGVTLFFLERRF